MKPQVIITIDSEGETVIAVNGAKGKVCKEMTAAFEKALGTVRDDKLTSDYILASESVRAKQC